MAAVPQHHPIRLVVREEELRRSRLTVLFRLLLALPHFVWLMLWGLAASIVSFVLWLAVLINGQAPSSIHDFVAGYVRYATQFSAYLFLAANPYPGFRGAPGYPVDVEIDPPERQSRWTALVRLLLALPAIMLASSLGVGFSWSPVGGFYVLFVALASSSGVSGVAAFLAWFASLVLGREPRGLRDVTAYALGYGAQTGGYALLLTGRYPSSDPGLAEAYAALPDHPVRIVVADDLGRPRITVLFRLLLAIPHFVWLFLWLVPAFLAVVAAWFVALVTARVPLALHRFLAAYVRYATHVFAYVYLVGRRFPGFTGRAGSYGIDLEIAPPERHSRWKTLFRLVLAIPALLLASALSGVSFVAALLGWWYALVTGRMPEGLRNLAAACLRYAAQTYAYLFLLTERYPHASPLLEAPPPPGLPPFAPAGSDDDETEPRRPEILPIVIVCALVAAAALLGLLGIRSLGEPPQAALRILAPPGACWTVTTTPAEDDVASTTYSGCGLRSLEFDVSDGLEAHVSTQPPGASFDLGAILVVEDEVVRTVTPAPRGGFPVSYGGDVPEETIVVRVDAAEGGCWLARIDDGVERGCGSRNFPLHVVGTVSMVFERQQPAAWPLAVALHVDGRVVQTYGPITDDYPVISGAYSVPREDG